jgi:maleate cis-trans isomerase
LLFGSGWRSLEAIELLEQDLDLPVAHPVPARVWAVEKRLRVNEPVEGFGRLLAEMP